MSLILKIMEVAIALFLLFIFILVTWLIVERTIKKEKEEDAAPSITLKLPLIKTLLIGILEVLWFSLGLGMFFLSFLSFFNSIILGGIFFSFFGILFTYNFPFFLNHIINECFRTIVYEKATRKIIVRDGDKEEIIDLLQEGCTITYFKPLAFGKRMFPPGANYGKIVIKERGREHVFSEMILTEFGYLHRQLMKHNNYKLVQAWWQFNFV